MSESTPTNGRGLVAPMDDLIEKVAAADPDEFDDDEALMARAKKFREEMEKKSSSAVAAADPDEFDDDEALMARAKKFREEMEKMSQLTLPSSNLLLPRLHGDSVTEFQPQEQIPQQPVAPFSFGNNMRYEFKIGTPAGRTSWRETASNSLASFPLKSASRSPAPARFGNPFQKSFFRHQSRNAELFKTVDQNFSRLKQKLLSNTSTPEGKRSLHFHMKRLESYQERDMFERAISPSLFNQPQINAQSRVILCQWMNEFCSDKRFLRCTFHRAITYLDVFLAHEKNVSVDTLQVLGAAAIFSAAKLEEPEALSKHWFLNFGDDDQEALGEKEGLLQKFHSKMVMRQVAIKATPYEWLQVFFQLFESCSEALSSEQRLFSMTVLDVVVLAPETASYPSSLLAAAVLFVGGTMSDEDITLTTGYAITGGDTVVVHVHEIWVVLTFSGAAKALDHAVIKQENDGAKTTAAVVVPESQQTLVPVSTDHLFSIWNASI